RRLHPRVEKPRRSIPGASRGIGSRAEAGRPVPTIASWAITDPHEGVPMRRTAPVFALFFLAPLVAEFFLGDFPITMLPLILVLAPMYGGGALLIREVVRRTGRGWPTIALLALAFGVFEEGV